MEKEEALSFTGFHKILKKYLLNMTIRGQRGDGAQEAVYGKLFEWAYERAEAGVPPEAISRWVRGKESVSRVIRRAAMASPEEYCRRYAEIFRAMKEKNIFSSVSQLEEELLEALKADKMQDQELLPGKGEDCEILAFALVAALNNDSIKKEVKVKPSIMEALKESDERCKNNDNSFNSAYALDALLAEPDEILLRALDRLEAGLGGRYKEKMREYVMQKDHRGSYVNENLENRDYIFYAKKYAFLEQRKQAVEIDLMRGLLLTDSKTIHKLWMLAGGGDALVKAMREAAEAGSETTTIPVE